MKTRLTRSLLGVGSLFALVVAVVAADPPAAPKPAGPDLSEYKTVENATTSRVSLSVPGKPAQGGYLGARVEGDDRGRVVVADVQADSPAARAGLQNGDVIARVEGQPVLRADLFRELVLTHAAGDTVKLSVMRGDRPMELNATLVPVSRPMKLGGQPVQFGAQFADAKDGGKVSVDRVMPNSPADKAGLKVGDVILSVEGAALTAASGLSDLLASKKPGDALAVVVLREDKEVTVKVELAAAPEGRFGIRDSVPVPPWKKDAFRLAVVCVEFNDVKHNPKVEGKDWDEALFSQGTYAKKESPTGQTVHGSLNDYYREQSYGAFHVEGKVFDWVEVSKKRSAYSEGSGTSNKSVLLGEAVDKLLARDGKEVLKDFDGLFFLYAGERVQTNRGALYYPHSGSFLSQGKRWSYMLAAEGGGRMTNLTGLVREFGFLLGLPDLSARPENAGSEGCGVWCAMSEPLGEGRPQHLCAWSKELLGWVKPAVIDPTVKQKLILAPIEDSPKECVKVLVKPDGSEYFLLENRRKKGFDAGLPAEGLLIWRVINGRPVLEESHGVEGAAGPKTFLDMVPFPSPANNAFTPLTTPSSRSPHGGGLPVSITEIRRLSDGRITFHVGYDYQ